MRVQKLWKCGSSTVMTIPTELMFAMNLELGDTIVLDYDRVANVLKIAPQTEENPGLPIQQRLTSFTVKVFNVTYGIQRITKATLLKKVQGRLPLKAAKEKLIEAIDSLIEESYFLPESAHDTYVWRNPAWRDELK